MNTVIPNEYPLRLTTGEQLDVSEIDMSVLEAEPSVLEAFSPLLALCTQLTRSELEEAKAGWDSALKVKLRSPPAGCLVRIPSPLCGEIGHCSMASRPTCTTKNLLKKGGGFPVCWTYSLDHLDGFERSWAAELCDAVVHAWRQGRHVIVVV